MAAFVTNSHMKSIPTTEMNRGISRPQPEPTETTDTLNNRVNPISQELLKKYIQYARTNVRPVLRGNTFDQEKVAQLYVALRKESATSGGV
eukprot:CAMPEP_0118713880 /NCGR_PEP_ID=MMETSP0800-20121206/25808_1 /TAXON_ID=210618 ORGANISM="Striatella unipunctata, Strain CCMP2910" /NCGR_SAMPLE_ID=MMETSP0800 /ASSEMBLY_ACC=CAM_ASM_000638 /LENGTH=90 /DNA_ID=CAMNT_0006619473 /DNA_START=6 /DNA_END=275 /DNA_ORIENTATION=+